jgi:hypothetical protein
MNVASIGNESRNLNEKKRTILKNETVVPGTKRKESKIPFENAYVEDCYKFIIGSGN